MSERLLDANEVADWLGVPFNWVRESTRSEAMPCVELGRYRRYQRTDVEAWLDRCKKPGRPIALRRYVDQSAAGSVTGDSGLLGRPSSWRSRDSRSTSKSSGDRALFQPYRIVFSNCESRSSFSWRPTSGCSGFRLNGHIQARSTLPSVCLRPPTKCLAGSCVIAPRILSKACQAAQALRADGAPVVLGGLWAEGRGRDA